MLHRTIMVTVCILFAALSPALAEWYSSTDGPDVFDNTTVHAGVENNDEALVVQCDKESLKIAYIQQAAPSQIDEIDKSGETPGELFIKTDSGPAQKFDGNLRKWNNKYFGMVVSGRDTDVIGLVSSIGSAKGKINVGMKVNGTQDSATFDSIGSSAAMSKVVKLCKLGDSKE